MGQAIMTVEDKFEIWKGLDLMVIKEESYKTIYELAEKRYEDVLSESESITNKSIRMVVLLPLVASYMLTSLYNYGTQWGFIALTVIICTAVILFTLIMPKNVHRRGVSPQSSIHKDLNSDLIEGQQIKLLYYNAISIIACNIKDMRSKNTKRARVYLIALSLFFIILSASAFLVVNHLPPLVDKSPDSIIISTSGI